MASPALNVITHPSYIIASLLYLHLDMSHHLLEPLAQFKEHFGRLENMEIKIHCTRILFKLPTVELFSIIFLLITQEDERCSTANKTQLIGLAEDP